MSNKSGEEPHASKRCANSAARWLLPSLGLLFVLFFALLLELLISPIQEVSLESVTVDASQPLPYAEFQVQFGHGTRLSTIALKSLQCNLEESGTIYAIFYEDPRATSYRVEATCPEEDVQAHADLLWKVLTESLTDESNTDDKKKEDSSGVGDFLCFLEVQIHFAHFIPYTHTIVISSDDDLVASGIKIKEEGNEQSEGVVGNEQSEGVVGNYTVEGQKNSTDSGGNNSVIEADQSSSFVLRQLDMNNLEMAYRVDLSETVATLASKIHLILPSLEMGAVESSTLDDTSSPSGGPASRVVFEGVNCLFSSQDSGNDDGSHWAVFGLTCPTTEDCTWFNPIVDWYRRAPRAVDGELIVDVTVNGHGSFLERLLGQRHTWSMAWNPGEASSPQGHRKAASAMNEIFLDAATDCLTLSSVDSESFDFAWCWLLKFSEGLQVVGMANVFDYMSKAVIETEWNLEDEVDTFDLTASILMELGKDKEMMNMTGEIQLDWSGVDMVEVETKGVNVGNWFPFDAVMTGNGRWDTDDDILTFEMQQGKLVWDGDLLADAIGSFTLDLDELTANAFLNDPAEGLACDLEGEVLLESDMMQITSVCEYSGDTIWDIFLASGIYWNDEETSMTFFMNFEEKETPFQTVVEFTSTDLDDGISFVIDSVQMQLNAENIIDASGDFHIDWDNEVLRFAMFDAGRLDYGFDVTAGMRWDSDILMLQLDRIVLYGEGQNGLLDAKGQFLIDLNNSTVEFSMEDNDYLGFTFDSALRWENEETFNEVSFESEETFTLFFDKLFLEWETGRSIDWIGNLFIDLTESSSQLEFVDSGYLDIFLILDTRWSSESPEGDDGLTDNFSIFLERFLLGWYEETRADISGELVIDFEESSSRARMEDTTALEFSSDVDIRWPDLDDAFALVLETGSLVVDAVTIVAAQGRFEVNTGESFIMATMEDTDGLNARFNGTVSWINDDFTDYFLLQLEKGLLEWDGETKLDLYAMYKLDEEAQEIDGTILEPDWSMQVLAENSASPTFLANLAMTWASPRTSSKRISIDSAIFEVDDETYLDQDFVVEYEENGFDFVISMLLSSKESADLEMDMNMTITYMDDPDTLQMVLDHMKMGWKEASWIDSGGSLLAAKTGDLPTMAPTNSPTTEDKFPTVAPTSSPVEVLTGAPNSGSPSTDQESFTVSGIEMRLVGAKELDDQGKADFEETLGSFYQDAFNAERRRHRQLAESLTKFESDVKVIGQMVDDSGNTISYDQTIRFVADQEDDAAAKKAQELLLEPLSSKEEREEFVGALKDKNTEAFNSVTAADAPDLPEPAPATKETKEQPDGNNALVIALSTVAAVLLVCCCSYWYYRHRQKSRSAEATAENDPSDPRDNVFDEYQPPPQSDEENEEDGEPGTNSEAEDGADFEDEEDEDTTTSDEDA